MPAETDFRTPMGESAQGQTSTSKLAEFIVDAKYEDLPEPVVAKTKLVVMDTIGCAMGAMSTDMGRILHETFLELGGAPESTIMGYGEKTSPAYAAWINSKLGNSLDADDVFFNHTHFAPLAVFPALALAEKAGVGGKAFLTAVAVAYDVGARAGIALKQKGKGVSTHSWTVLAAVASAAKIYGLNKAETQMAIGIGCSFSTLPVTLASLFPKVTMLKYNDFGPLGFTGVMAALLAKKGYTANPDILDHEEGFGKASGGAGFDYDLLTKDFGKHWYILDSAIKIFPSCRWSHIPLELFIAIMKEQGLKRDDIEEVILRVPSEASSLGKLQNPDDGLTAQFSFPYVVSLAAAEVPPGPWWQSDLYLFDERIREFARRVKVENEPRWAAEVEAYPGQPTLGFKKSFSSVSVVANGKTYTKEGHWAKGDPWTPETQISTQEAVDKFRNFASGAAPFSRLYRRGLDPAIEQFLDLENVNDVGDVIANLK